MQKDCKSQNIRKSSVKPFLLKMAQNQDLNNSTRNTNCERGGRERGGGRGRKEEKDKVKRVAARGLISRKVELRRVEVVPPTTAA